MNTPSLLDCLSALPLVAILRGLTPEEAPAIGDALVDAGFRLLEVPLNSPRPLDSIAALARLHGDRCLIGAGTVLDPDDVPRIRDAGGRLIVMPHGDRQIIDRAKSLGLFCVSGVSTPTEAFAALAAGADALKLFPAEALPPAVVKAWRAVLPRETLLLPVGGIEPASMSPYLAAGASGFGLGSALYRPGASVDDVRLAASRFVEALPARSPLPEKIRDHLANNQ